GILAENTSESLEIALDRLEQRRGEQWSAEERLTWWKRLAAERMVNVLRLRRYAHRGVFPINEHASDRAVPVFVDNYDTACAVGHLMRESGWGGEVAAIQAENNLVYVTDVTGGPVAAWVAGSGLTQEEAALIQPAYPLDPAFFDTTVGELNGGSISRNGVRYENFLVAGDSDTERYPSRLPPEILLILIRGESSHDFELESQAKLSAKTGFSFGPGEIDPQYHDWLLLQVPVIQASHGEIGFLRYTYDVIAEKPGTMISGASLYDPFGYLFNRLDNPLGGASLLIETQIREYGAPPGSPAIAEMKLASEGDWMLFGEDDQRFSPREKVTVQTSALLINGAQLEGLIHSFHVIPEPSAAALGMIGLIGTAFRTRRPRP
ncbi:MAG TPA: hypothetical protein VF175_13380, partial [Lacipirellula sp.]